MVLGKNLHCLVLRVRPQISSDYSEEDTPVPISNTVVKLLSADGTRWVTARENRTSLVLKKEKGDICPPFLKNGPMVKRLRHRPFTAVTRVRFPVGSPT